MAADECDYMSDNFLAEGSKEDSTKEDIRPGLLKSRTEKRQIELAKKKEKSDNLNKFKNRSLKSIEKESLQIGLQNPINTSNKGYAMLEKMGFKPGSSLGKNGAGLKEPIPVPDQRNFREGLGVKAALKEMRKEKSQSRKEATTTNPKEPSIQDFRARIREEVNEREAGIDLFKSQKTCHSLDTAQELEQEKDISSSKEIAIDIALAKLRKQHEEVRQKKQLNRRLLKAKQSEINIPKNGDIFVENLGGAQGLAVVPEGHPANLLSKQQSDELHAMLLHEVESSTDMPTHQFHSFEYKQEFGAAIIKCTKKSRAWLRSAINSYSAIRGLKLRLKRAKKIRKVVIDKPVCIGFIIPGEPITKDKILNRLGLQNPQLDVSSWWHYSTITQPKFYFIKLLIPESHLITLNTLGNWICFGFSRVKIFLLEGTDRSKSIPPQMASYAETISLEEEFIPPEYPDSEVDEAQIADWFEEMASSLPQLGYSEATTANPQINDKSS